MFTERSTKAGLPGTLVYNGEKPNSKPRITVFTYMAQSYEEHVVETLDECLALVKKGRNAWINVDGLQNIGIISRLGDYYKLHPLIQEDIIQTDSRPKLEEEDNYLFITFQMLTYNEVLMEVVHEQVSIAILKNVVLSFQERQGDVFDGVRDRIRTSKGLVRERGSDYLAYSLIDAVVDNIFSVLEKIGDGLETLEDETVENPTTETVHKIHELKKQMILVRKSVWPLREVVSHLERCGSSLIKQETQVYLRDVYDHLIQIIDSIETNRDVLSGMLDIYLSSTSNRLNEVMKFLTVVGTIFIPLTFISSVYGMNFRYMPEIDQVWGYPLTLVIMSLIAAYMLLYFRRKKWI